MLSKKSKIRIFPYSNIIVSKQSQKVENQIKKALAKMSTSLNFQWRCYWFIAYATLKYVGEVNPEL